MEKNIGVISNIQAKKYFYLFLASVFIVLTFLYVTSPVKFKINNEQLLYAVTDASSLNDIFDPSNDEGYLTIRYVSLEAQVKSGDAVIVRSPDGKTMLIDAGGVQTGIELDRRLDDLKIEKIDYAIATHPHHDHIGGYLTLLESREIGQVLMPNITHKTATYNRFIDVINKRKINVTYLYAGDRFYLGEDVEIEVFNPEKAAIDKALSAKKLSTDDINNMSLVLKVKYKDRTFLFTADIYKKQEKKLIESKGELLDADFLHAPHHGDKTSSSQVFIDAVSPQHTVISSNILQSRRIYERYQNKSETYATSLDGHILIQSDGESIHVKTEKKR